MKKIALLIAFLSTFNLTTRIAFAEEEKEGSGEAIELEK